MKTCKISMDPDECKVCMDMEELYGNFHDCSKCLSNNARYELISVGSNFFGSYAMVLSEGKIQKVPLNKIYDVREEK